MQLGKVFDHTKEEYFHVPLEQGQSHWSEPYKDIVGAKAVITTYSAPIRDASQRVVGVVFADISTDLLNGITGEEKVYQSTQRYLVTGSYNRLAGKDTPLFRKVLSMVKEDEDKTNYFTLEDDEGTKHHVFYTLVGGKTDWVLINVLDDSEVFGRLRFIRLLLLLPAVIGLFFAWFVFWRSSHSLRRLRWVNAEKERIDGELHVASEIQQNLLPERQLHRFDVDISGSLVPAREVGGDLFDYYIRDEKLFFGIGDVSGKGAPAAIVMGYNLFDGANTLVTDILIPVGAMGIALFTGWFVPKARYQGSRLGTFIYLFILRWLVPIALIIIFLNSLNII